MKFTTKHIVINGLLITIGFLILNITMADEVIQIPKVEEKLNKDETAKIFYQKESNSVKKDLAPEIPKLSIIKQEEESQPSKAQEHAPKEQSPESVSAPVDVVISKAAIPQIVELKQSKRLNDHVGTAHSANKITESSAISGGGGGSGDDDVQIVSSSRIQQTFLTNDMEMPDAYRASFYFFFGISSAAILFIVVRVYRLRLSRAERKYGVQGDRANQELTPLPMAIEDINSDEDDHTLFDINRHNIRIL